eukprot:GEMP01043630.1.p1 GENE.GEMP01043630.1~~GEMP01043630.1.p1  ORF type:complete len:331 (+),score=67.10 GEMP01043630.1:14-1006(+)
MSNAGVFRDVFIWVTPRLQDGSSWSLDAGSVEYAEYDIAGDNVVTLRIIRRQAKCVVKVEPAEDDVFRLPKAPPFPSESWKVEEPVGAADSDDRSGQQNQGDECDRRIKNDAANVVIKSAPKRRKRNASVRTQARTRDDKGRSKKPTFRSIKVNCLRRGRGIVTVFDRFGVPGKRCLVHGGGKRCNVPDCIMSALVNVSVPDKLAPPGGRCFRHGGGRLCNVANCNVFARGTAVPVDNFGPMGRRCANHGGDRRCKVSGCASVAKGKVLVADLFGEPGLRCWRHGGGRRECSVDGCTAWVPDKVTGSKRFRCRQHAFLDESRKTATRTDE